MLEACARAPAERERFLVDCCGAGAELQAEVAALLAAHTETASPSSEHNASRASSAGHEPARSDGPRRPVVERDLLPGIRYAERYRIVDLLGRGGMGEVLRADDLRLEQAVMLKFLPVAFALEAEWLARLYGDVRLARTITHPTSTACKTSTRSRATISSR